MNQSAVFSFYRSDDSDTTYHVDIYDGESGPDRVLVKRFTYESDVEADDGELLVIGDYVYISPHNKFLALVDGVWYLNDYVSTTPRFNFSQETDYVVNSDDAVFDGLPETGFISLTAKTDELSFEGNVVVKVGQQTIEPSPIDYSGTAREIIDTIFSVIEPALSDEFDLAITRTSTVEYVSYTITIVRKITGNFGGLAVVVEYNPTFLATANLLSFSTGNITGGLESRVIGSLQQSNDFAYTVRYRYADGHVTKTAYPKFVKTTNQQTFVGLDIDIVSDIQGGNATIEIFRRTGSESFFLIRRLRNPQPSIGGSTIRYVDTGDPELNVLDQKSYTWTKQHKTHIGARDRYVRANVKYENRDHTVTGVVDVGGGTENNSEALPFNTKLKIYTRARFNDGLESFHKLFGNVTVTNEKDQQLLITLPNLDPEVKELAFYGQYQQTESDKKIPFLSTTISNINVPTQRTRLDPEDEQDRPGTPHVFFAYRYIQKQVNLTTRDFSPNRVTTTSGGSLSFITIRPRVPQAIDNTFPDRLYVELGKVIPTFSTISREGFLPYVKKIQTPTLNANVEQSVVYELEGYEALEEAIRRGLVQLRSNPSDIVDILGLPTLPLSFAKNYSTELPDGDFQDALVDVIGLTNDFDETVVTGTNTTVDLNNDGGTEIFLELNPESVYARFTNTGGNNQVFPFYLLGLDFIIYSDTVTNRIDSFSKTDKPEDTVLKRVYDYDTGFVSTNSVPQIQELVYLGTFNEGTQTND